MSPKRTGWRPMVAGLAVCAFLSVFASAALAEKTASISGYVYLDYNDNGVLDPLTDYAIRFAKVTLKRDSDPNFAVEAFTDVAGFYHFDEVYTSGTGTFTLQQQCYTCSDGIDKVGQLFDENGVAVSSSLYGTAHNTANDPLKNQITGISLQAGFSGVNYNFAEKTFPLELISKRMFMDLGTPPTVAEAVPEPSTMALSMLFAGLAIGIVIRRRRRP